MNEIGSFHLKIGMRREPDVQIEISGFATLDSGLTLTPQPDPLSFAHPRRYRYFVSLHLPAFTLKRDFPACPVQRFFQWYHDIRLHIDSAA